MKVEVPRQGTGRDKYGVGSLKVGQSKFIPGATFAVGARAVHQHGARRGKKFACRVWSEDGKEGLKVWRTK